MRNIISQLDIVLFAIFVPMVVYAELIPTGDNAFYYKMGGGQGISVPAYDGATSIPLHVDGDIGLGYNCGVFNPKLSITNSLNAVKDSFQDVEQGVVANATSAITEFPLYALSRADPDLYNMVNNALLGAREDLKLSTKSCQTMQSQISQGKNPYADWASLSMGNDWKYHMGTAGNHLSNSFGDSASGDINQVSAQVSRDNGDNGIPWVHGASIGRNGVYAGGKGQPAINIIHDTSVAGYNVILQSGRTYDDESAPARTDANAHLVDTWSSPKVAADWITDILGDEKITTYLGGDKQSAPGVGLLPANQRLTNQILVNLQKLVSGQTTITITTLQAVSAPGVMVNTAVIHALQQKEPVTQAILLNKLAQEVAASKLIDEALLARQILQEGSQIPAIYSNNAAQNSIQRCLTRLDQAINSLLFNVDVHKKLVSDTVSQVLETIHSEQQASAIVQTGKLPVSDMQEGAIKTNGEELKQ